MKEFQVPMRGQHVRVSAANEDNLKEFQVPMRGHEIVSGAHVRTT